MCSQSGFRNHQEGQAKEYGSPSETKGVSALSGLKVVECGDDVPSAYCAKFLADFGAEVIKVEKPGWGDETRRAGPFPGDLPDPEASGMYLFLNTNKMGITLNYGDQLGAEILTRLCADADILVLDGTLARGDHVHYRDLSQANPRLIVVLTTPFGLTGPYAHWSATEIVLMQMSGVGYFTPGEVKDPELEPPLKLPGRQAELMAGINAALAAMFAVFHRELTGVGQVIDVSTRDATMLTNVWNLATVSYTGLHPARASGGRVPLAPLHMLPCKDGYVHLNCVEEEQWRRFVELLGSPDWSQWELFKDRFSRGEHWDVLEPLLAAATMEWEKETISHAAEAKGVPCTVVRSPADLIGNAHLAERKAFAKVKHPVAGNVCYPGAPFKMSETPWQHRRTAPRLGEHNYEILSERLGFAKSELVAMRQSSVI